MAIDCQVNVIYAMCVGTVVGQIMLKLFPVTAYYSHTISENNFHEQPFLGLLAGLHRSYSMLE